MYCLVYEVRYRVSPDTSKAYGIPEEGRVFLHFGEPDPPVSEVQRQAAEFLGIPEPLLMVEGLEFWDERFEEDHWV